MVIPRKRHGIWWMSMPVPVAVALCVTCFFFGYFTHSAPRLGPSLQTQMLDASIRQNQQQKRPQQKHQQTQTPLQPEVITPQQEQAELKQQQQQQQEQEVQHQQAAAAAEQQKKEQLLKEQRLNEQHQQLLEQQQPKQQKETSVQQAQQHQQPPEGQSIPQQPQPQSRPAEAQPQQPQPQTQQQQPSAVPPAVDTADAERQAQTCLQKAGLLQPLLPPAESGHNHYTITAYQILSWHPRIVVYPNFIDRHKAAHIIKLAQHRAKRSDVKLRQGEELDPTKVLRASAGVSLKRDDDADGVLGWLEDKIEAVTLILASHGEPFTALRHQLNENHMDTIDPEQNGAQKTERLAKMIIYLSDVEEGGETVMKKDVVAGDLKKVSNDTTCDDGDFKYKPRLGDAVLFYSLDPDDTMNPKSLHGGCPVIRGTKWVLTKWLHKKPLQKAATK